MQDLFDMVQSQTFVSQIGYGLIRIVLVNLMPELRPLFHSIERGPSEMAGGRQGECHGCQELILYMLRIMM